MRVVFIAGPFYPEGYDSHLRALSEAVDLIVYGQRSEGPGSSDAPPPAFCRSRTLHPIPARSLTPSMWGYRGLAAALAEDRPDIVHVVAEPWQLRALQGARWARLHPQAALVMHGVDRHWWDVSALRRMSRRRLARWSLARVSGYLGESTGAVEMAKPWLRRGVVTDVVHTCPGDATLFSPPNGPEERAAARTRLSLPVHGTGIGFLGRLVPEKGPMLFIEAFRRLAARENGDVWAVIAGEGPLASEIDRRVDDLRIVRLSALRPGQEVAEFFRSIDVLAVPSYRIRGWDDQGPRVLIEAMLSECLVVGARSGAIPEILGDTGLLAEERDVDSLTAALARAVGDRSLAVHRPLARERALAEYSGESVARMLAGLYQGVMDRHASAA